MDEWLAYLCKASERYQEHLRWLDDPLNNMTPAEAMGDFPREFFYEDGDELYDDEDDA